MSPGTLLRGALGASLILTSTVLVALPAGATSGPPWQNLCQAGTTGDANNLGTLTFYDATGVQITTGSTLAPIPYAEATGLTPKAGNNYAALYAYTPKFATAPGAWSGGLLSGATQFPNAAAPAPLTSDAKPVVTETSSDNTLDDYITNRYPNTDTTDTGYVGVYELRVKTSGTGGSDARYASADIAISGHTWTEVYGTGVSTSAGATSVSAVGLSSPGPLSPGAAETLTVTATAGVAGSVTFLDGGIAVGPAVPVSASGFACTTITPPSGAHNYTATFTPVSSACAVSTSAAATALTVFTSPPPTPTPVAASVSVSAAPASAAYGTSPVLHVVVGAFGVVPTGSVTVGVGTATIATLPLVGGQASVSLPVAAERVGVLPVTVSYSGDANVFPGTASGTVTVTKAGSLVAAKFKAAKVKRTAKATITVSLKGGGFTPTGKVSISLKRKALASGNLRRGTVALVLPKLKAGRYTLTITYAGSLVSKPVTKTVTLTVT